MSEAPNKTDWSDSCLSDYKNITFIVDNISTAFAVAIIAKGKAINCIYECKEITWRKTDYVALFDLILSDVTFLTKEIISVPHPYFRPTKNLLLRFFRQLRFARSLKKQHALDASRTYVSSTVSSLLIANKKFVKSILIDEGMGSLRTRHHRVFYRQKLLKNLKDAIANRIFTFRFQNSPQITLVNDSHSSVIATLDYRDFDSAAFLMSLKSLSKLVKRESQNVLVLLKGPSYDKVGHPNEAEEYGPSYIAFNLRAIMAYIGEFSRGAQPRLFIKSHPSLGSSHGKLNQLISELKSRGVVAFDICDHIEFPEASSLPAEGLLRYLDFEHILALDASSLLWNVAHRGGVKCFMPLKYIVQFSKVEGGLHTELYRLQYKINQVTGNHVHFFEIAN